MLLVLWKSVLRFLLFAETTSEWEDGTYLQRLFCGRKEYVCGFLRNAQREETNGSSSQITASVEGGSDPDKLGSPCGKQINYPDFSCLKNADGSWSCKEKPYMVLDLDRNTWTIKPEE